MSNEKDNVLSETENKCNLKKHHKIGLFCKALKLCRISIFLSLCAIFILIFVKNHLFLLIALIILFFCLGILRKKAEMVILEIEKVEIKNSVINKTF